MSDRYNPYSIEMLLIEYMLILREQTTHQSNVVQSFIESNQRNYDGVRSLIQRYLETMNETRRERTHNERYRNVPNPQSSFNPAPAPVTFFNSGTSNITHRNRSFAQSPLSFPTNTGLRRRNTRPRLSTLRSSRPTQRRRNILNQILETTLYTPTTRRPARLSDISANVSEHIWSDVSNTTDQSICPITQENFRLNDRVSRIDHCGHCFMTDALMTYFTEFDHRCPMCRYNISSEIFPPRTYAEAAAAPAAAASTGPEADNSTSLPTHQQIGVTGGRRLFERATTRNPMVFDISYNIESFPSQDTSGNTNRVSNLIRQNSFDISWNGNSTNLFGFDFNSTDINQAVNQLSNAMISSISTAMTNPDNSGNTIAAEYSLFLPTVRTVNTNDNSTNTENINDDDDVEMPDLIEEDETY